MPVLVPAYAVRTTGAGSDAPLQIYCFASGIGHYGSWVRWGSGVANLFAVREGADWRVQIVWPNGLVHYFGRFTSETDVLAWIAAHDWLKTTPPENSPKSREAVNSFVVRGLGNTNDYEDNHRRKLSPGRLLRYRFASPAQP